MGTALSVAEKRVAGKAERPPFRFPDDLTRVAVRAA
jgi:hypothetical protein